MFLILMMTKLLQPSLPQGTRRLNIASIIHQCSLLTTHAMLVRTKWLYPSNATSPDVRLAMVIFALALVVPTLK